MATQILLVVRSWTAVPYVTERESMISNKTKNQTVANLCTERLRTRVVVLYRTDQLREYCTVYRIQLSVFVKEEFYNLHYLPLRLKTTCGLTTQRLDHLCHLFPFLQRITFIPKLSSQLHPPSHFKVTDALPNSHFGTNKNIWATTLMLHFPQNTLYLHLLSL